ncbi:MAG: endonuclease/exonuclease/phosphatase family protein [Thermoanaerobaculales bacterium]|nr:endonuclease/exonuclease/phosphatase family protein [Thermoanaerobaculales bacterium]
MGWWERQSIVDRNLRRRCGQATLPPMQNGSKSFVVAVVIVIILIAVAALILRDQLRCAGFPGPAVSQDELPSEPADDGSLRIASWNVRNFPLDERPEEDALGYSRRTNICDFETAFGGLNADIYGLQEVNDIRRFQPILRRACGERSMDVRYSAGGGRHGQHLAIAWDNSVLELVGNPMEVQELVLEPGMRPAFAGYFRSLRAGGFDFTLIVVHLESGPQNFADRRRQNRELAKWIGSRVDEFDDPDVIVLGDFNTTGSPRGGLEGELQSVDSILGRVGLERLHNPLGCTSYWEGGGERDGIHQPSLLDHVFVGGIGLDAISRPLETWLHCSRWQCSELISRAGEEDGTFWDVSDHCPLTFEIRNLESQNKEF